MKLAGGECVVRRQVCCPRTPKATKLRGFRSISLGNSPLSSPGFVPNPALARGGEIDELVEAMQSRRPALESVSSNPPRRSAPRRQLSISLGISNEMTL